MKNIISIFLLFIAFVSKGQGDLDPVKISSSSKISGDTLTVEIKFTVQDDWMVYDSLAGEVGPIPLSVSHEGVVGGDFISVKKPALKHKFDDIFEVDLWYFTKEASYEFMYKLANVGSGASGNISLEYMSCNLTSGVCLPPKVEEISVLTK